MIRTIARFNGPNISNLKLLEECGELIQAVAKHTICPSEKTRMGVEEEIADTLICIEQVCYHLDITQEELDRLKGMKARRTMVREGI